MFELTLEGIQGPFWTLCRIYLVFLNAILVCYHPDAIGTKINVGFFNIFSEFVLKGSKYYGKMKRIREKIETSASDSLAGRDCQCRVVWNWPYASSHLFARPKIQKTLLLVVCFGAPICSLAASRSLWPRVGFSGDCSLYRINCKSNWCPWSLMPWSYFTSFRVPDDCRFFCCRGSVLYSGVWDEKMLCKRTLRTAIFGRWHHLWQPGEISTAAWLNFLMSMFFHDFSTKTSERPSQRTTSGTPSTAIFHDRTTENSMTTWLRNPIQVAPPNPTQPAMWRWRHAAGALSHGKHGSNRMVRLFSAEAP